MHSLRTAVEGKIIFNRLNSCSGPVDPDVYLYQVHFSISSVFVVCFAGTLKLDQ